MTQFFAILKDSFREAVDGFVIYVMLGMSLLVILIVGSMSFKPAEPQDAFNKIVSSRQFKRIVQDRGRSRYPSTRSASTANCSATDVQPVSGGYKLRPHGRGPTQTRGPMTRARPDLSRGDSFRQTVALWAKQPGQTIKSEDIAKQQGKDPNEFPDIEISMDREATPKSKRR